MCYEKGKLRIIYSLNIVYMAKVNIKAFKAAKIIVDYFAAEVSKKYNTDKKYDRLVAVDDDVFSAYVAAKYYHKIYRETGKYLKVDVIGGYGLMSGKINPKIKGKRISEAEMLAYVLERLGVRRADIDIVCSRGTNTGQNLSAYSLELSAKSATRQNILFCLTKRLAGRFYLTQLKQQPSWNADYIWEDIPLRQECQLYNGKRFAGCLPYLSEAASIYDRYIRYADPEPGKPQFMMMLNHGLPLHVIDVGEYLCRNYRLKMPEFSFLKIWQFIRTYGYFWLYKQECRKNLEDVISQWQESLMCYNLDTIFAEDKFSDKEVMYLSAW